MQAKHFLAMLIFLALIGSASAATCASISQYGITWTFDKEYECGKFANGDNWVVGSVNITGISPGRQDITQDEEIFTVNGNMVNPPPGKYQGYDSRGPGYVATLSVGNQLMLNPGESLVSTISWKISDPGCPNRFDTNPTSQLYHMPRPCIRTQAVLTCLSSVPPAESFRPPYAGTDKPLFNASQLNESILPNLEISGTPDITSVKTGVQRPWIDHMTTEQGDWILPSENLPNYGRDIANRFNVASLMLMTNIPANDKHDLAIYLTQIGIDYYYIVNKAAGSWEAYGSWGKCGGAICIGRKWPIILAGVLLNNEELKNVAFTYPPSSYRFAEDSQIFYITQADVNRFPATTRTNCAITHETYEGKTVAIITDSNGGSWWNNDEGGQQPIQSGRGFPSDFWVRVDRGYGVYNTVRASAIHNSDNSKIRVNEAALSYYGLLDTGTGLTVEIQLFPTYRLGYPEWGERHAYYPQGDFYSRGYRTIGGKTYHGAVLSALILNAKNLWNNNAFFDWTDMYMAEFAGWEYRSNSAFTENMWDTYRANYGPIWTETPGPECIDNDKLLGYISQWKQGSINMAALMQKIAAWKSGAEC